MYTPYLKISNVFSLCVPRYLYFTYKNSTDHTEREQAKDWLIYASVVSAVAFIILLLLLIMRKRIALVVQLFREAGKAIAKMPLILIQPLWTLVALIALVGAIGVVYSYVETSGDAEVDTSNGIVKFVQVGTPTMFSLKPMLNSSQSF